MTYKAILFDMNGVLIDDEDIQENAFRIALEDVGISLSSEEFIQHFIGKTDVQGLGDFLAFRKIVSDEHTVLSAKHANYDKLIVGAVKGYAGVTEFIESAIQKGLKIAVVTSTNRKEAVSNLHALNMLQYFDVIVTGDDITNGKPDPEGYLKGAKLLGVKPSECIVIEDAPSGLAAAKSASIKSVGVTNTHTPERLGDASIIVNRLSTDLLNRL